MYSIQNAVAKLTPLTPTSAWQTFPDLVPASSQCNRSIAGWVILPTSATTRSHRENNVTNWASVSDDGNVAMWAPDYCIRALASIGEISKFLVHNRISMCLHWSAGVTLRWLSSPLPYSARSYSVVTAKRRQLCTSLSFTFYFLDSITPS